MASRHRPRPAAPLCALAVALLAAAARAGEGPTIAGFHCQSTSTLVSKRIGTITRQHETWLTEETLRVDHAATKLPEPLARQLGKETALGCEALTIIVHLDSGEVRIANRDRRTFVRHDLRKIGSALCDWADAMNRHVSSSIGHTRKTKQVGGRTCRQSYVEIARSRCTVWVQEGSRDTFDAVRGWARAASGQLGSVRAPLVVAMGGLGGLPRQVTIGDPERLALTWTVDRYDTAAVPSHVFTLPDSFREDPSQPAMAYTLLEHVYLVGEASAAYFAKSEDQRDRSLMPRGFDLTTEAVLQDFYQGRVGSERYGIFRWAKPLTFFLAPELWHYPLSGRSIDLLMVIGVSFRGGALRYYPALKTLMTIPAN
ncbi:MAG: hypothetical protein ACOC8D_00260 [bacterium]